MYRVFLLTSLMLLSLLSTPECAASRIGLVDGTEINGDVLSVSEGRYTIRSATLGQIELPESSIRFIKPGGGSDSGATTIPELHSIQQAIVNSPELMQIVTALQSDPELQAAINDPELMQLVMSGNFDALQGDPRIRRLLTNPSIKAIVGQMSSH